MKPIIPVSRTMIRASDGAVYEVVTDTANKILRSLPVPMVVVPRDFGEQGI